MLTAFKGDESPRLEISRDTVIINLAIPLECNDDRSSDIRIHKRRYLQIAIIWSANVRVVKWANRLANIARYGVNKLLINTYPSIL